MNIFKSTLIALVLFSSSSVFAKTGKLLDETKTAAIDVVIEQQKTGKVLVGFQKFGSDVVKIKIYDADGAALYSERVKNASLVLKRFDVSRLPEGDYSYEVSIADYAVEKTISK
ncbi:hypothetical protein [Reichenbachiella versicolor]|uniref:hypothetical protein n=1 Tax=Reichenbachiella versicolor TaxID=1821036 RepID=UPI000D6DF872|nr:hypothetical protein [Reichenbachiella versicolor]